MLRELRIKNLAIIDDAVAQFEKGFNVLTGETGAGKSILIDALCLALGRRASNDMIRSGENEAMVEAFFELNRKQLNPHCLTSLQEMGIDISDGIILKRILSAQGKSRAYINDSLISIQTLSEITKDLIDVYGQSEHQSLLSNGNQLYLLDSYADIIREREEFEKLYKKYISLEREINELTLKEQERIQHIDLLEFQIKEIDSASLTEGEEDELIEERKVLANSARLVELANMAYEAIYSSDSACITTLSRTIDAIKEIQKIDSRAADAAGSAAEALPLLEEVSYFLRDYKEGLEFNPDRLEEIEARLELIKNLKRKYGGSIKEILGYRENAIIELGKLQHSGERIDYLKKEMKRIGREVSQMAQHLSGKRKAASREIENSVIAELGSLSMPDTRFSIKITQEPSHEGPCNCRLYPWGIDSVEYLISPNIGEELRPLSKVASGGELSRIMLALKSILTRGDRIHVLIFDEVDAGIGGKTAEFVGLKLKKLSHDRQVICITHLPQIATYADNHLKIEKKVRAKRTTVEIKKMEKTERASEIARMLSGDTSHVSLKHAKELLKKVKN
jgi:DNA repair protein RecN (Recombination protein N)